MGKGNVRKVRQKGKRKREVDGKWREKKGRAGV